MKQSINWPVALLAVGALLLLFAALYFRGSIGEGSQPYLSPSFRQMSPAEQKAALAAAERARRYRGARPTPAGR